MHIKIVLTLLLGYLTKGRMNDLINAFNRMQEQVLQIVDIFNQNHRNGHDFGTGDPLFPAEIHTIQAIGNHNVINITDLAKISHVSKPTISERVKKLERTDLIMRKEAAGNRKEVLLQLTERGWIAYKGHEELHNKMFIHFHRHFGKDTANQIRKCRLAFSAYLDVINK
jgi:DNA-binding MarR family transcriptional regulator